jgi:beta-alanine--pyruvate transaminase
MGAVIVKDEIHDAFMTGPEHLIEFFHGYTYSAHPLACAAGLGTLDTYAEEGLLTRAGARCRLLRRGRALAARRAARDRHPQHRPGGRHRAGAAAGEPAKRAFDVFLDCWEQGRADPHHGRHVALSPPLIIERGQIDQIVDTMRGAMRRAA